MKNIIKKLLPTLEEGRLDSVAQMLLESGIESIDDLEYVQESDLISLLKPIHARKLLAAWKSTTNSGERHQ